MYTEGMNATFKYLAPCNMLYPEINEDVWQFFCLARSKLIPINGPLLQSEANESTLRHNYDKFTVSNGWLKSFCMRHRIKFSTLHGEGAQVSQEAVDQWMSELPNVTKNYTLRDVYNCDETSIFFKTLPNKTLHGPGEKPMGNKVSKDQFSILVCANAVGEKEKLLVIGKCKRPHSFLKYNSDVAHHVTYKNNKCGWMTTEIFTKFLNSLNNKMKQQNRHILMFLDNCSSHPHLQLPNIKLIFYPKNTTLKLQAMDQRVKYMLNLARMEARKANNVTKIIKEIKIFDAIQHAKVTWEMSQLNVYRSVLNVQESQSH